MSELSDFPETPRGNGTEPPDSPASGLPRARIEELEEAVGTQDSGVTLGKIEARYICRDKIKNGLYFRAHPDRSLWQETIVLIDEDGLEKTSYLVHPGMQVLLQHWLKRVLLVPCINTDHEIFVYRILRADLTLGQRTSRSEMVRCQAAQQAITKWTTVLWDGRQHVSRSADGDLGEPNWPADLTRQLINFRTFQDHYIRDREHPIARIYLGLARR